MKHDLMKLPYSYDSLEPYIDAKTMEIHYSKHHKAYVDNLNAALDKHTELFDLSLEDLLNPIAVIPADIATAVKNNAGGVFSQNFFWNTMSPDKTEPSKDLLKALEGEFQSLDSFKEMFTKTALSRFGSGWAWLVKDSGGKLKVYSTANQDTPVSEGNIPLLAVDVWEHAYYLKYQNRRAEYLENFWNVINWDRVSGLYK